MSCTSQLLSSICERVICCRYTSMFVSCAIFCRYTSMLVSCVISCRYKSMFVSCVMCCRYTYMLASCVICCRFTSMFVSCVICCRYTSMLVSFRPSVSSWLSSCVRELYVAVCARANIRLPQTRSYRLLDGDVQTRGLLDSSISQDENANGKDKISLFEFESLPMLESYLFFHL